MPDIVLRQGREKSLLRYHPWVLSGSIQKIAGGEPGCGETVAVRSSDGKFLAWASWSPKSQISARVLSFSESDAVTPGWIAGRVQASVARRRGLVAGEADSYRLIHGEADGLPGCVVDRYGDWLVAQFLSAGAEFWRGVIVEALREALPGVRGIYERSDTDSRGREGLENRCGLIWGEEPPERLVMHENGMAFWVDVRRGHKTGFYLDQRENRAALPWAKGGEVLNAFCYTGGFGLRAAREGAASVTQVDLSGDALALAKANEELNRLNPSVFSYVQADVFAQLRKYRDMGRSFDLVVLDPPKFAEKQCQLERACRGYKDINLFGARLTRPGGVLLTYSCSGAMTPELFRKVVGDACRDAHREAYVLKTLMQAPDHPVSLNFPEGRYLTGLALYLP